MIQETSLTHPMPHRRLTVREELRPALVVMRREIKDTLRDWRLVAPIVILVTIFPFLANFTASRGLNFVNQYGAELIIERLLPFLMLVVGFFPSTFSLVIALETFVGEKERRSLEPLLATPLTNFQLYLGKLLAATIPPVFASYLGMAVYLTMLWFTVGWRPPISLLLVAFVLATAEALVMVTGAVIVSSQSTSVRAANLLASFIIIPMALLLQAEAGLLLFSNFRALWLIALFLIVLNVLLMRLGVRAFDREQLLGRDIDQIDLKSGWRTFWGAAWPHGGLRGLYLREVPQQLRALRPELALTVLVILGGAWVIGSWTAAQFPLPAEALAFQGRLDQETFQQAVEQSGILSAFSAWAILENNIRSLVGSALLGSLTMGIGALMLLTAPLAIIAYIALQVSTVGINPWFFLAIFVLPHGILELPAAIIATAQAVKMGDIILRPPEEGGGFNGMVREVGRFVQLMIAVVIPLLLAAAMVEAHITPQLVIRFFGK